MHLFLLIKPFVTFSCCLFVCLFVCLFRNSKRGKKWGGKPRGVFVKYTSIIIIYVYCTNGIVKLFAI